MDKAVQLLAQRNHSKLELKKKLTLFFTKKNRPLSSKTDPFLDEDTLLSSHMSLIKQIDQAIDYCHERKWLDDYAFAAVYIEMRSKRGFGYKRIIMELNQRGITNDVAMTFFAQNESDTVLKKMSEVIEKKYGKIDKFDIKQRQKIYRFLLSRGFSQQNVNSIYSLIED
ncbi:regulatory protein RecX [Utexia brackfieldae]|uniref:regulatory protein RecX n=1 Tax=Utexia brackfieldae TaxID=3074108 RepID=UPI00370D0D84